MCIGRYGELSIEADRREAVELHSSIWSLWIVERIEAEVWISGLLQQEPEDRR